MKKIFLKKKIICIISILAVFLLIFMLFTFGSNNSAKSEDVTMSKEIVLDADYGDEYIVEDVDLTFNDETKQANKYVVKPNGERVDEPSSITIDSYGSYSIVYYANFGDEVKSVEEKIVVEMPLFSLSGSNDSLSYVDGENNSISYTVEARTGDGSTSHTTGVGPNGEKYSVVDKQITGAMLNLTESNVANCNEVIDFNKLDTDDPFIEFYILPTNPGIETKSTATKIDGETVKIKNDKYTLGTRDFGKMTLTLTDVYDENNYVNIVVLDADNWFCYVMTSTRTNQLSGWSYETKADGSAYSRIISNGRFGTGIRLSMTNVHYSNDIYGQDWSRSWCKLFLDYEEKALYVSTYANSKTKVLDFDDSTNVSSLWEGFSEGKAKLSIECTQFSGSNPSNIVISKLNGKDVISSNTVDNDLPSVQINYDNYNEKNIPNALVNEKYPIFDCIMQDGNNIGIIKSISVKHNGENIELVDGCFCPIERGIYQVTYSATDMFGNEVNQSYNIEALDSLEELRISFSNSIKYNINQGEYIELPQYVITGGSGKKDCKIYALLSGESELLTFTDNKLLAEKTGNYLIEFLITDYIGQKYIYHYTVNVAESNAPVFIEDVILPQYVNYGQRIILPTISGRVYAQDGTYSEVESTISVIDGLGERTLTDNIFEVQGGSSYPEEVTVKYTINANGKKVEQTYQVNVLKVFDDNGIVDFSKYFDCLENSSAESTESCLKLTFTNGKGKAKFIRQILTDGAELKFAVPDCSEIERINIYFENPENGKVIKMSYFTNEDNYTTFNVNDGISYTLSTSLATASSNTLIFNDLNATVQPATGTVVSFSKYLDGSTYDGFANRCAYISFEVIGTFIDEVELSIQKINGHNLKNTVKSDSIGPKLSLLGNRVVKLLPGDTVYINKAVAYDIIDTYANVTVSVYKEVTVDGKKTKQYVVADNGVTLNNVSADIVYTISNLPTGKYSLYYLAKDSSGKSTTKNLAFEIQDMEAPVIIVSQEMDDYSSVNKTITLSKAEVSDNVGVVAKPEGDDGALYYIFVYTPDGVYKKVDNFEYKFEKVGLYKFTYVAFDNAGNMGTYIHYVQVTA